MNTNVWKYWRISRFDVESREAANRAAPRGFTFHTTTVSEYVYRRKLQIIGPVKLDPKEAAAMILSGGLPEITGGK